jgi:hypothetical protein
MAARPAVGKDKTRTDAMDSSREEGNTPPWVRLLSVPTCLLGIVAFLLPWVELSCGPIRMSVSGYEIATGSYSEKMNGQAIASRWKQPGKTATPSSNRPSQESRPSTGDFPRQTTARPTPMLWLIPITCAALLVLALFGLPRFATVVASCVGIAYLAYFGIVTEQQASDPRLTGGIVELHWMFGFWASWVGLLVPPVVALVKPRRTRTAGAAVRESGPAQEGAPTASTPMQPGLPIEEGGPTARPRKVVNSMFGR